uniref:Uncharacterized protein n=1 Tax=Anguilla anguilla TaxID=7936 RepID=A0A0E9PWP2_ANGAN
MSANAKRRIYRFNESDSAVQQVTTISSIKSKERDACCSSQGLLG